MGYNEDTVVGEYTSGAVIEDADGSFVSRFLYAFWRLCDQQIADIHHPPITRTGQLLAARADMDPDVRVLRLRRTSAVHGDDPHGRQWSHQWIVRMHKVRQWYPSQQRHKVIYRGPYLKGPADRPLLGGEPVTALIR